MLHVNRPIVAVLCDHARHDLVERVATLGATGLEVRSAAGNHGSGFPQEAKHCTLEP
jgi:hypothetical protein